MRLYEATLVVTFAVLAFLQPISSYVRSTFEQPCNKTTRCDSKASLTCEDGICRCLLPEKMTFDTEQEKCVTIAGEKCLYTAVEMTDTSEEGEKRKWSEQLSCVSRATCSSDGYCVCDPGYFENLKGYCEEKHFYGEVCRIDSHCKDTLHLVCNSNGTCDCNELTAFDITRQECVGKVGSLCKMFPNCVQNAVCPPKRNEQREVPDWRYGSYQYTRYETFEIDYSDEICGCKSGFSETEDGHCLVSHGESCDFDEFKSFLYQKVYVKRCMTGMTCREGSCVCKYEDSQEYDSSSKTCKSLVGVLCTDDNCIDNAECVGVNSNMKNITEKKCKCKEGYIEVNRRCEIQHGGKCGSSAHGKCDTIAPLSCINSVCQCNPDNYYDTKLNLCRGMGGTLCTLEAGMEYFCGDGFECVSYRNKTAGLGRCECQGKLNFNIELGRSECLKIEKVEIKEDIKDSDSSSISWMPLPSALKEDDTIPPLTEDEFFTHPPV